MVFISFFLSYLLKHFHHFPRVFIITFYLSFKLQYFNALTNRFQVFWRVYCRHCTVSLSLLKKAFALHTILYIFPLQKCNLCPNNVWRPPKHSMHKNLIMKITYVIMHTAVLIVYAIHSIEWKANKEKEKNQQYTYSSVT